MRKNRTLEGADWTGCSDWEISDGIRTIQIKNARSDHA